MKQLEAEAGEDARTLARLWQLQNKMESVGSGASYGEKLPGLSSPDSHLFEKAAAVLLADPGLSHPAPNDFSLCDGKRDSKCPYHAWACTGSCKTPPAQFYSID